ncbi:MAG: gliding motility-associated C-terminal domain-containing protein [Bacteroidia bacterium]|nr:gliding motility-associated C-terminal domain-containing protein [Bacteroidia bacterium]
MENNNNFNEFDTLLKQSLEGAQIPVPPGVWETVGSSIGAYSAVTSKITLLKILSLKYISAVIISGAVIWGTYEALKNNKDEFASTDKDKKINIVEQKTNNNEPTVTENNEKENSVTDNLRTTIELPKTVNTDSIYKSENPKNNLSKVDSSIKNNTEKPKHKDDKIVNEQKNKIENHKETIQNNDSKPEEENNTSTNDSKYSSENIVIPNAFTPYDVDGYNDCYRIIIENETKFVLQIFDNNRRIIFETNDKNTCWNGKNKNTGEMCPRGAYTYKIIYELISGFKKTETGLLNLF